MGRIKTDKEPVKLRQKALKNGNISLYLDIYYNGMREYEFLKLYLIKGTSPADREKNKKTLQLAQSIKAQRQIEIQNNKYGFSTPVSKDILFLDYFEAVMKTRKMEEATLDSYKSCFAHVKKYVPANFKFKNVDRRFIQGFKDYLDNKAKTKFGEPLSQNTKNTYFGKFRTVVTQAMLDGIIPKNPALGVPVYEKEESKREYLTLDEVKKLAAAECRLPVLKRMFLFSCLTGLRWSDVSTLTWGEVQDFNGKTRIIFKQEKTNGLEYMDLNPQAADLMGKPSSDNPDEPVFGMKYYDTVNTDLQRWCLRAGVDKHITFHSGRHTFAVMMLDLGTDIFTLQKLMGHKNIKSTMIYAKILDKKKQEAVAMIPNIFE